MASFNSGVNECREYLDSLNTLLSAVNVAHTLRTKIEGVDVPIHKKICYEIQIRDKKEEIFDRIVELHHISCPQCRWYVISFFKQNSHK
jgi:hypothetical protein